MVITHGMSDDRLPQSAAMNGPDVIPSVNLQGSTEDKVRAIDATIARLRDLRADLTGGQRVAAERPEWQGPYINAPVWPWFCAGWAAGAVFVLLFVLAWANS